MPDSDQTSQSFTTWNRKLQKSFRSSKYGVSLESYGAEEIVPGVKTSEEYVRELFTRMASINFCPCRALDEANKGTAGMLSAMRAYVAKDLSHFKQHSVLAALARRWEVGERGSQLLLQHEDRALLAAVAQGGGGLWD